MTNRNNRGGTITLDRTTGDDDDVVVDLSDRFARLKFRRNSESSETIDAGDLFAQRRAQVIQGPGVQELIYAINHPTIDLADPEIAIKAAAKREANKIKFGNRARAKEWVRLYGEFLELLEDPSIKEQYLVFIDKYLHPAPYGPTFLIKELKNVILNNIESFSYDTPENTQYSLEQLAAMLKNVFEKNRFDAIFPKTAFLEICIRKMDYPETGFVAIERLAPEIQVEVAKELIRQKMQEIGVVPIAIPVPVAPELMLVDETESPEAELVLGLVEVSPEVAAMDIEPDVEIGVRFPIALVPAPDRGLGL